MEPAQSSRWPGWLSQLPERYAVAPDNVCFKAALLAASYAILHKNQNNPAYQNIACELYAKGSEAISQALAKRGFDDNTINAIALLDVFLGRIHFFAFRTQLAVSTDNHGERSRNVWNSP